MTHKIALLRVCLTGGSLFALSCLAPVSAQAGFFDQLFGGGPLAPRYDGGYEGGRDVAPAGDLQPFVIQRRHVAKRVSDEKPVLQKTTDLMHDKTLRPGDAVMLKTGIHIYQGAETATHRSNEFVALDDARRVKPAEKIALASIDGTRNDPAARGGNPDTLASGRSAAVGTAVVAGVAFTDQRGKTIRYVGP